MKKLFYSSFVVLFLFSSCNFNRKYKYVEVILDKSIFGEIDKKEEDPKIIKAASDSDAYLAAYQKFCISVKVNNDMKASYGETFSTPLSFKLYNDKGVEITSIVFASKSTQEKEIESRIFSMSNSMDSKNEAPAKTVKVDSSKVKELEKYFNIINDEFSNNNKKWYKPKSAPKFIDCNGIYCYFQTENGVPSNLRFSVQYYASDWLFFKKIQFSIDEKAFEYVPLKVETDHGNGGYIWEWFDENLSNSDSELIFALANAKKAKMKLIGSQYYNVKVISNDQIISIKRTIDLYHALGGQY